MNNYITCGIPDTDFIRGTVPMTKEEIRVLALSKLRLHHNSVVLDIGAGTGSVTVEAARILPEGKVYAIEKNREGLELIKENVEKFDLDNVQIIPGEAPDELKDITDVDRVFIGGSGGRLYDVFNWIADNTKTETRVVVTAITLETLSRTRELMAAHGYVDRDVVQVAVTRFNHVGNHTMMKAQNPVFIISGAITKA